MMLALALGRTHSELLDTITSEELTLWLAYHNLNPINVGERAEIGSAIVASTIANCHSNKKYKIKDFLPSYGTRQVSSIREWALKYLPKKGK